jgi:hypothetical protein
MYSQTKPNWLALARADTADVLLAEFEDKAISPGEAARIRSANTIAQINSLIGDLIDHTPKSTLEKVMRLSREFRQLVPLVAQQS